MRVIPLIFILFLYGCSANGEHIPDTVKKQVGTYVDSASICFNGVQKEIEWYGDFIENGDTTIYRFDIPCQSEENYKNRIMPIEYKAVFVNDSLIDILEYWNLFNAWISEFPEPFIYKDLKYWKDLTSFDMITSIKSDYLENEIQNMIDIMNSTKIPDSNKSCNNCAYARQRSKTDRTGQ